LQDNPSLTTRNWRGRNPLRIVLDQYLILPDSLNIFKPEAETFVIADKSARVKELKYGKRFNGIKFVDYDTDFYTQLFQVLIDKNVQSVIIEGGERVLNSFIERELWDEARIFYGDKQFIRGVKAPNIEKKSLHYDYLGTSKLTFIKK